jgi:hypothetical protein
MTAVPLYNTKVEDSTLNTKLEYENVVSIKKGECSSSKVAKRCFPSARNLDFESIEVFSPHSVAVSRLPIPPQLLALFSLIASLSFLPSYCIPRVETRNHGL